MKTILVLAALVLSAAPAFAQQSDENPCGPEFRRWSGHANSIKSGIYAQLGAMGLGESEGVPEHMFEGYLKNCRLAAQAVRVGGCYDFVAKKVVFPATVEEACEAVVEKVRAFEAAFKGAPQN